MDRVYDPNSVAYYYYNNETGSVRSISPTTMLRHPKNCSLQVGAISELKAALLIQSVYRAKQARKVQRAAKAYAHAEEQVPNEEGWIEVMDAYSGEFYYFNVETEEQQWDIPESMGGEAVPKWTRVYDPNSVAYYYYNNETGSVRSISPTTMLRHPKLLAAGLRNLLSSKLRC